MCLYIVKSDYQQWRMTVVFQKWGDGFLYDSVYLGVLFHDGRLCLVCNAGLCLVPNLPSPRNSEGWSQKQNVLLPHCQLVCATSVDHCLSVCIRGRLLYDIAKMYTILYALSLNLFLRGKTCISFLLMVYVSICSWKN